MNIPLNPPLLRGTTQTLFQNHNQSKYSKMSLFRVDPNHPFEGPHQTIPAAEYGAPLTRAKAAMIIVHGRGATAQSMFSLADQFAQPDFHFRAPQAQNHTWYPYSFMQPKEKNQPGLSSGLQRIRSAGGDPVRRYSVRKGDTPRLLSGRLSGNGVRSSSPT